MLGRRRAPRSYLGSLSLVEKTGSQVLSELVQLHSNLHLQAKLVMPARITNVPRRVGIVIVYSTGSEYDAHRTSIRDMFLLLNEL